jgi:GTP cyclohydrolase I
MNGGKRCFLLPDENKRTSCLVTSERQLPISRSRVLDCEKKMQTILEPQSTASTSLQELMREVLVRVGEDPERDGLRDTPERMECSMLYLTKGYQENAEETLRRAMFDVAYDEMVIVKDIEMFSLCEHHLLPFFGKVHVAYIPQGKVIGLSKIPRLVDVFARRLQVQERLTTQIAEAIESAIKPQGVGVVVEARHMCMMMRGVEKQHSSTITSSMLGAFRKTETRNEFLALIHAPHS